MSRTKRPLKEILCDVRDYSHCGGEFIGSILTMVHDCEVMQAALSEILHTYAINVIGQILIRTNMATEDEITCMLDALQARMAAAAEFADDFGDWSIGCYSIDSVVFGHNDKMKTVLISELQRHFSFTYMQLEMLWHVFDGSFNRAHSIFRNIFVRSISSERDPKEFIFESLAKTLEEVAYRERMKRLTMVLFVLMATEYDGAEKTGELSVHILFPVLAGFCMRSRRHPILADLCMRSPNSLNVEVTPVDSRDSEFSSPAHPDNEAVGFFSGINTPLSEAAAAASSQNQSPRVNLSP